MTLKKLSGKVTVNDDLSLAQNKYQKPMKDNDQKNNLKDINGNTF